MAITPVALKAYAQAAQATASREKVRAAASATETQARSFSETVRQSLASVNDLQQDKAKLIEEFASGKNQNVHELMIGLQKASLAMELTAAVRNKVMNAYQEVMRLQF
ncbi:flagellar hook-basal body complex protein FliE [Thermodesulfomicrobium sp. WS]|uniref:flagellar hook-basal body complex protein FliE n=1 Tax=Thermodesulfomicrobium sp. WS TaxID=3004129 RepID=UPI00249257B8|nr:flagellar hook-basal body complex protein FliE [Thermodesulfomicrobium sp. WS]BDV02106.1 flagellar hook-basal body complex protein FliE [Thermodesulfomicrobium sp. WS]